MLCAFEGQVGTQTRIEAFRQKYMAEDNAAGEVPFFLMPKVINLVQEQGELVTDIKQQLGQTKPVAIVLDTLNRSFQGSESSDTDMTAYVAAAEALREAFSCAVIVIHHCGHDGSRARGHTALLGAIGAEISVKKDPAANIVTATVEMMKDGEARTALACRLERLVVGQDVDGYDISSCVVVPIEGLRPTATKPHVSGERTSGARERDHRVRGDCQSRCLSNRPRSS